MAPGHNGRFCRGHGGENVTRYRLDSVSARSPAQAAAVKRRGEERASVYTIAALVTGQGLPAPLPCTVRDLSRSGARLEIERVGIRRAPRRVRLPQDLAVYFCPTRTEVECRLSWQDGNHFGVAFTTRIDLKRTPCGRLEKAQPRVR